jgi:hypothetical protein
VVQLGLTKLDPLTYQQAAMTGCQQQSSGARPRTCCLLQAQPPRLLCWAHKLSPSWQRLLHESTQAATYCSHLQEVLQGHHLGAAHTVRRHICVFNTAVGR